MTDAAPAAAPPAGSPWRALALLVAPAVTLAGLLAAPRLAMGEDAAALVVFAGGAGTGLLALALAAPATLSPRASIVLGVVSAGALAVVAALGVGSRFALAIVNGALVAFAHAVGASIGRRVAHPGHLLPACVVGAAADLASVFHPAGPSHAIASSRRAIAVLTVGFAVPGTDLVAPALGAGDLLFLALIFGAVAAHRLSLVRAALLGAAGVLLSGLVAALVGAPIPALVAIGAAIVIGLPEARRLRPEDRRTAAASVAIAVTVLAALGVQRLTAPAEPAPDGADAGAAEPR